MAKSQIKNYVFRPAFTSPAANPYPNTVALITANRKFIQEEAIAWMQLQVTNNIYPFAGYYYDTNKCRRDISYVLEAYLSDLSKLENRQTIYIASRYWENNVSQVSGPPEVYAHQFIQNLIVTYILGGAVYPSLQTTVTQYTNNNLIPESAGITAITTLSNIIINVFSNPNTIPALSSNRGYIKFPGYWTQKDLLLITNTSKNVILYNFADNTNSVEISYSPAYDSDFPGALNGADKITTVVFDIDTSSMMVTDSIQIFVEKPEQMVRLNPIATDAMERMKVGIPQSMLDADFEYGLQPTKWQAIGLMRNYPSIYEIPNSTQAVISVTTDASSGSGGVGSSLLTVTTLNSHGFSVNQPFTIKALANSISGFSRAEGSFLVNSVLSANQFTYYAKSKVGSNNGDVLSTTYTQLRTGAFYTGAGVGTPSFSVYSNGTSGSITTRLIAPSGSLYIGFTGTAPPVGAPITGTGIASGSQISAVNGSGGTVVQTTLSILANIGDNTIVVDSTTGIIPGLLVDRGDGVGVAVTSISSNSVTLSGALTSSITGSNQTYTNISATGGTGSGAVFSITRAIGTYSAAITSNGQNYAVNDVLTVIGSNVGGATPANNVTIRVLSVAPLKSVATFDLTTLLGGAGYINGAIYSTTSSGTGTGLTLQVTAPSGIVTGVTIVNAGSNYQVGSTITLTQPVGAVLTFNTLVAGTGYSSANSVATSGGSGTGLAVDVIGDGGGGVLAVNIVSAGTGYAPGDSITISAGNSNATFNVVSVSVVATVNILSIAAGGDIQSVSTSGTTLTAPSVSFVSSIAVNTATTAQIANSASLSYSAISSIIVTFASNHGFVPGNTITVQITSTDVNAQLAAGAFFVEQVPTSNTLIYTARSAGAIANTLTGNVYARPDCFFIHRPFDGGVQLGTGGPAHGAQAIRMSKKYIRYQSGKGVMYNTGALFAPSYNLQSITASGTGIGSLITITTDDTDHGCQVGGGITISGVTTSGYNGQYTVFSVVTERVLTVVATSVLGSTVAQLGNPCRLSVRSWHGSTVRSGIFDDQNGMFWAYDGQRLSVTKRSSTFIIAGSINIAANSNLVTGFNSRFTQQLAQGDRIVIRGMTHIISSVISDTQMTVTPDYRGATNATNAKAAKIIDLTVAQTNFNLDPLNGSGPSGYNADVTKMQMIGIQHTWYGAGFIDFMLRGSEGNYVFAHRFRNSNYNTEAYMRSGNQPVRYEVINEGARDRLTRAILSSDTTLPLFNAFFFPTSGTVLIDSELISFTGNDGLNLLGCVRGASLSQFSAGSQRNFTGAPASAHSQYAGVVLVSNTITPIISHWGSAFMIDGQFDNDRGYIFNYAATGLTVTGNPTTAFLMRLAPSVSDAQVGDLGERELLNRAQLLINSISCTSDPVASGGGAIIIQGILNPINYPVDPTNITWTTLNSAAAGGQPSFTQIANGGSVTWSGGASTSTATVQGAFTTTITAKSFAPSSNTLTAIAFSPVTNSMNATAIKIAQTGNATSFAPSISPTYSSALSTSRTDFLIPQTTLNSFSPALAVGDILSAPTYLTSGQTVVSITNNYVSLASVVYARIIMSAAANATSTGNPATPTSGAYNVAVTFTNAAANTYVNALSTARTDFLIPQTQYAAFTTNIVTGDALSVATYLTGGQTVVSVTQNYVTFSGVAYARVIMSAAASATSPAQASAGTSVTTVTVASSLAARYNTAISTSRSDFLITQSQLSGASIANTDILSVATYLTGSQTISNIVANYCTISGTAYAQIIMSSVGNSTSAAGTGNTVSITATSSLTATYSTALNTGRYDFLITDSSYSGSGIAVGDGLSLATFLTGSQTIQSITQSYVTIASVPYTRIVMSGVANSTSTSGAGNDKVITVTAAGSAATYTSTNYLFFTSSTWLASGAVLGTRIAASYTQFPAGTSVTAIATRTYGSTTVYRVTFTQASNATISAGGTPTFQFGAAYALPGEQVFSFVSNPGATDVLDLSGLKELTSTAIGGRGTFPNGPDTLAINVYKISGTQTTANVIVRWGEAQA